MCQPVHPANKQLRRRSNYSFDNVLFGQLEKQTLRLPACPISEIPPPRHRRTNHLEAACRLDFPERAPAPRRLEAERRGDARTGSEPHYRPCFVALSSDFVEGTFIPFPESTA